MNLAVAFLLAHALTFSSPEESLQDNKVVSVATRDSVVAYAKTFLGKPYKYACASPDNGFDCSGFTWFVFNHYGVEIPRSSRDYATIGKRVSLDSCKRGDLILFTGTDYRDRRVGHVGIIVSNSKDSLMFIHSSSSDNHFGVTMTNYYKSNYPKRFVGVTSVLPE